MSIQMLECILIKSRKISHHNKIQYFITRMFDKHTMVNGLG